MNHDDILIPYDAQCQHGRRYSDCQICSGAKADFEQLAYALVDEWDAPSSNGDVQPVSAPSPSGVEEGDGGAKP